MTTSLAMISVFNSAGKNWWCAKNSSKSIKNWWQSSNNSQSKSTKRNKNNKRTKTKKMMFQSKMCRKTASTSFKTTMEQTVVRLMKVILTKTGLHEKWRKVETSLILMAREILICKMQEKTKRSIHTRSINISTKSKTFKGLVRNRENLQQVLM